MIGLDPTGLLASLLIPAQILFVNLLLSADNALVIALACRGLRQEDVQRATLLGIVGAIGLRLVMGSVALLLLRAPLLQMAAGVVLLFIAVRLTLIDAGELDADAGEAPIQPRAMLAAVWMIIMADVAMSLDNVVAIAAIAQGSFLYIGIGLALSIPMLIWGSNLVRELLDGNGWLVLASGAFLGWVAGGVAVADPLVAPGDLGLRACAAVGRPRRRRGVRRLAKFHLRSASRPPERSKCALNPAISHPNGSSPRLWRRGSRASPNLHLLPLARRLHLSGLRLRLHLRRRGKMAAHRWRCPKPASSPLSCWRWRCGRPAASIGCSPIRSGSCSGSASSVDTTSPGLNYHWPYPIEFVMLPARDRDQSTEDRQRLGHADADRRREHRRGHRLDLMAREGPGEIPLQRL